MLRAGPKKSQCPWCYSAKRFFSSLPTVSKISGHSLKKRRKKVTRMAGLVLQKRQAASQVLKDGLSLQTRKRLLQAGGFSIACRVGSFACRSSLAQDFHHRYPWELLNTPGVVSEASVHVVPKASQNWPFWIRESRFRFFCTVFISQIKLQFSYILDPKGKEQHPKLFPYSTPIYPHNNPVR